ncbi:three-helix bundle dimerization domain-containing protein [Streptomyces ortus]|uniref:Arsenate reductase ArsC n=1 Tax=Streptomyces ortus TaxID=2867268 RepID=A0ABT3V300_9ACTN|nr:arsenate reductase ArsC [Streptomyces ortus]MCX4233299.1 arsenate reductase ArsC [Streptomyces ortus]
MNASPPPVFPDQRLAAGVSRLASRYRGQFSAETIQRVVIDSYDRLAQHAHVRSHLVVLAERLATQRLDALAHVEGQPGVELPRELFVCTHNAGRSQMAAALLTHRAAGQVVASSAGTHPASDVEPAAVQVLAEADLNLCDAFPKPLTEEVVQAADVVITMGWENTCPVVLPGRRYLDWPISDPEGAAGAVSATR